MEMRMFQIDAFASKPFEGNPAAVCPLPEGVAWPADDVLQAIAAENNLSETAFFAPEGDVFRLRWFTPATEVDLCGHATLATAWTMFHQLDHAGDRIDFETRSGRLTVRRDGERLVMDFPANPATPLACTPGGLAEALGATPDAVFETKRGHGFYMAVFPRAGTVAALQPNFALFKDLGSGAVIATAPGDGELDFISRMFAPMAGIDEDPVTGAAHCVLAPYWSGRLGKRRLQARQISARGGDVACAVDGDRVELSGTACLFMSGKIDLNSGGLT